MADDIFGNLSKDVPQAIGNMAGVQAAKDTRAARTSALQGAIGGQIGDANTGAALGSTAGAIVSNQGNIANKATGQAQQAVGQIAEQALQGKALDRKEVFQQRKIQIETQTRNSVEQLRKLDASLAARFFDDQMKFSKDEIGRTVFTEQQLMDYAVVKYKRDEDFQNYKQSASQMSDRRMQVLKAAAARIELTLKQTFLADEQAATQEQTARLTKAKADMEVKIREQANANAERGAMFTALGTVVGAVAGIVGGPAGIAAGAALGGAAGSLAAASTANTSKVSVTGVKPTVARPIRRY